MLAALCPAWALADPAAPLLRTGPESFGAPSTYAADVPSAAPFHLTGDAGARERATDCLAQAVYYEAANQPLQGRQAVAQVVLNRLRHPAYPKSVCGVVFQGAPSRGCQFTFACDGALDRAPRGDGWRSARAVAEQMLDGGVEPSVGASTHYHTLAVHPAWSFALKPTRRIGDHQFYRFAGRWGDPAVLTEPYSGAEPERPSVLASAVGPIRRGSRSPAPGTSAFAVWGLPLAALSVRGGAVIVASEVASPTMER